MNDFFLVMLSLSLSGTLIALLLLLLKPAIKNRLSKTWQYYSLLIVVIRLLIPFGPETNLMGMLFNPSQDYFETEYSLIETDSATQVNPPTNIIQVQPEASNSYTAISTNNIGQMLLEKLWILWLIFAVVLLIYKITGYLRFISTVKKGSTKIEDPHLLAVYGYVYQEMKIKRPPELVFNEQVGVPMLIGSIRPVITLPDLNLKDNELKFIMQHELIHYKRLDIVYKWLVQFAACLHWFNPLVYWFITEVNHNCELSCDEAVIRQLDKTEQRAYGDMLLETIRPNQLVPHPVVSHRLSEDSKLIKERLEAIMKHKKESRVVAAVSVLMAAALLCGAAFAGVYAAPEQRQATAAIEEDMIAVDAKMNLAQGDKISFEPQHLSSGTICRVLLHWQGDGKLAIICSRSDGTKKEYPIENGKSLTFQIDVDGAYTIALSNDSANNINRVKGTINFDPYIIKDQLNSTNSSPQAATANRQTVVYENVEMRYYEGGYPYIYNIKTNNMDKTILSYTRGMLAFDKDGNPLIIDWVSLDSSSEPKYLNLYTDKSTMQPGETADSSGGWSLDIMGEDKAVEQIAYIVYCDKSITFADGTTWENPEFEAWFATFVGKKVDVDILDNYYPYVQTILN